MNYPKVHVYVFRIAAKTFDKDNNIVEEEIFSQPIPAIDQDEITEFALEALKEQKYNQLILVHIADYDPNTAEFFPIPIEDRKEIDILHYDDEESDEIPM